MDIKPIGGYFELEKTGSGNNFPQSGGVFLNTGRNALEYILISIQGLRKVYIPYYTCEVILEPLKKLGIAFEFYHLNSKLEINDNISVGDGEYIIYTNYFGIKDKYVKLLALKYKEKLIVDCAQALYFEHISGTKSFYSPRKFVGIPDGAIAFIDGGKNPALYDFDVSDDRMSHLFLRLELGPEAGYSAFRENANKLKNMPILQMSVKTRAMIESIDFNRIKLNRIRNFCILHEALKATNKFVIPELNTFECPMVYPYWTNDTKLKSYLIKKHIFVATYWPNILNWTTSNMIEYEFANNLIAIPCDQRYSEVDMEYIINVIYKNEYSNNNTNLKQV